MQRTLDLDPAEQARRAAGAIRLGTVAEVDMGAARVRVATGGNTTDWVPWCTPRAGGDRTWSGLDVGEQVVLACPEGDLARAVILGAVYRDAHPAPGDSADVQRTVYADGAVIEYDRAAHALTATLPSGATAQLTADGGITLVGDVTIDGDLLVTGGHNATWSGGNITLVDGDVVAEGISLQDHVHGGVEPGGSNTDEATMA